MADGELGTVVGRPARAACARHTISCAGHARAASLSCHHFFAVAGRIIICQVVYTVVAGVRDRSWSSWHQAVLSLEKRQSTSIVLHVKLSLCSLRDRPGFMLGVMDPPSWQPCYREDPQTTWASLVSLPWVILLTLGW